jgi:glycerol-3-phosphate acyltransferase PlsY
MISTEFLAGSFCVFFFSYFTGSIPFGYLIGKFNGLDIRRHGSNNIGATNIRRVLGKEWGIVCFLLDFLKGLFSVVFIGKWLGGQLAGVGVEWGQLLAVAGAIGGHVFPYTLDFRGGKGVATALGALLAVAFGPVIIGAIVWYITFWKSRVVSLASIIAAISLPLSAAILWISKKGNIHGTSVLMMLIVALLIIYRHKDNIQRLRSGKENKFSKRA